ncbi:hypothetical protein PIB30_058220 [Stylosanthes scabra]|uniref:Uncharacterized protein n=1 Tax=Stylosanthes scabra TaxID=79078 RepID=A0ABU6SJW3_9FABA|nr:hypothetical protein [Stylosanthes scabra]
MASLLLDFLKGVYRNNKVFKLGNGVTGSSSRITHVSSKNAVDAVEKLTQRNVPIMKIEDVVKLTEKCENAWSADQGFELDVVSSHLVFSHFGSSLKVFPTILLPTMAQ